MRVAMIGIKAIPAQFGGFETAVEEIARRLVRRGHQVTVYNRKGMADPGLRTYDGIELVTLPTLKSKNLSTIIHAFVATIHVTFRRVDVVHYFTTGATLFAPIPRILGKKIVCSVDGFDWQRAKWGRFARWYLRLSEQIASRCCHKLISDSEDVKGYYKKIHGRDSACITYGVREYRSQQQDVLSRFGLKPREYVLFVGRLVPENNVHHLIAAFERTETEKRLVIVGDDPWERRYVQDLRATRDTRVVFTGAVYGDGYAQLQQSAYLFVLPDEVGGTHPALVEAMGFGNCVLVNDTPSNLEVIGDAGLSYRGADGFNDLRIQLQTLLDQPGRVEYYRERARTLTSEKYCWDKVVQQHIDLYQGLLGDSNSSNSIPASVEVQRRGDSA